MTWTTWLFVLAQAASPRPAQHEPPAPPNVLLVVADDVGTDKIGAYRESPRTPRTPRIDVLAAEGILFRNAYAYSLCSSTRAALLTGRYGRRNGLGAVVRWEGTRELPLAEVTLAELLDRGGANYATAAIGKWHLSGPRTPSGARHPNLQGFEHYAGSIHNLYYGDEGEWGNYFHYDKVVDGRSSQVTEYATMATTDDALSALACMPEPWFLYVAYNAAHAPIHVPLGSDLAADAPRSAKYDAMVESLDGEFGRLLDGIPAEERARTLVVFLGDNGTVPYATVRDPEQTKATLFEGGTNVPLIVAGFGVAAAGAVTDALVHVVDVLPTVAELTRVDTARAEHALDGRSFAEVLADPACSGPRRFVYTEHFEPVGPPPYELDLRAVRDDRYKLVDAGGVLSFYDLKDRFDDGPPRAPSELTPAERERFDALRAELERIQREVRFEY